MSESETVGQDTWETPEPLNEDPQHQRATRVLSNHASNDQHSPPAIPPILLPTTREGTLSGQPHSTESRTTHPYGDLHQILVRAREEIQRLREDLSRHETHNARVAQERDEIQQRYTRLYENFLESVHIASEEEIRHIAHTLRATPGQIPQLLEPLRESIAIWLVKQQAEREDALRQKLETVEQQAATIRQELIREREELEAEREKFTQESKTFTDKLKAREAWLQNRWLAKAWGTAAIMFLVLPALQIYLLTQKAGAWNIIIIPTTICLVLTALINLARSRKSPPPKQSSPPTK